MFKKNTVALHVHEILRKLPTFLHIPLSAYPSFLGWMCQVQELNEHAVAMESRLGAALATEARALEDVQGVREDRLEFQMLAAEAAARADAMRAEKNLALNMAQDAEKKVTNLSIGDGVTFVVEIDGVFDEAVAKPGFCAVHAAQ